MICNKCDMVLVLKDFIKPIIQLLSNDIEDYNMRLLTTKCLNTSVALLYFIIGKDGIKIADYCDTRATIKRHQKKKDNNQNIVTSLKQDLLFDKKDNKRYIYYVLLTDGYFPYSNSSKQSAFFPGHVFIIEKIPSCDPNNPNKKPSFFMYQSYINEYDLAGHFKNNNGSVKLSYTRATNIIKNLSYILNTESWDDKCIEYWKDFTFVDTSHMKDALCKDQFYVCYKEAVVNGCIRNIKNYVKTKLTDIKKKSANINMNGVYGNTNRYDENQIPLTNSEMKYNLENLLKKL